jgi:dUTP pyrophosphatase
MDRVRLKVKKIHPDAKLPTYADDDIANAGLDLYTPTPVTLYPKEIVRVGLGIAVDFATDGSKLYMQLASRSGLASKGVFVVGGVVDEGYRGEIGVLLYNSTLDRISFEYGARIAQGIIMELPFVRVDEVDDLSTSSRGSGGFGSTGV